MKNHRLFRIVYLLLEKGTLTAPQLAETLEVSVRTIYRDVEDLSMAGVPVYTTSGKGGGISLLEGYTFDKALLSDDEQNQILFGIQSLKAADQNIDDLLTKLGIVFQKAHTNWIEVDFSRWGLRDTDNNKFDLIKRAILGKYISNILYCGTSGQTVSRDIQPLRLVFKTRNWYLQAFCLRAMDFRLFKLSRIIELQVSDQTFSHDDLPVPPIEGDTMFDADLSQIKLRFTPQVAYRIYDEFVRDNVEQEPGGALLVTTQMPVDIWLYSYLFSFGTDVEILEPLSLKVEMANYARNVYEHYIT